MVCRLSLAKLSRKDTQNHTEMYVLFFSSKSHKKVWVLRKCPSFASGENHGAHEKPTVSPRRKRKWVNLLFVPSWLGGGDFGKEGENKGWFWDIERSHWKQYDQNALANLNKKFLDYQWTGKTGMEAGMSMSKSKMCYFQLDPKILQGLGLLDNKKHIFYLGCKKQSAENFFTELGINFGVWIFFWGGGLNVIQFRS